MSKSSLKNIMPEIFGLCYGLLLLGVLVAQPLKAEPNAPQGLTFVTDPNQPVEIRSEYLSVDAKSGLAVFTGDPKMNQGRLTLTSDQITGAWTPGQPQSDAKVLAEGNVIMTSVDGRVATGQWATYFTARDELIMGDAVTITEPSKDAMAGRDAPPATVLTGAKLVVDMASGQAKLFGGAGDGESRGRVRGIFTPGRSND